MNRVATIPFQQTLSVAFQRSQQRANDLQLQIASGKSVQTYGDLGQLAPRNISAHAMLTRIEAYSDTAKSVGTTLSLYDAHLGRASDAGQSLKNKLLDALAIGESMGLDQEIENGFAAFTGAMNASEGGNPLFGGTNTAESPFRPETLGDLAAYDRNTAFANDSIRASATFLDGQNLKYGVVANAVGADLFDAFKTLASLGPLNGKLTDAQKSAINQAIGELDRGVDTVLGAQGVNGGNQTRLERLERQGEDRHILLSGIVGETEDANLAEIAGQLAQTRTMIEASYSVFSQLSRLSLTQYLR